MLMPGRAPIHIDTPACLDSRVKPSRRGSLSFQNVFNGASLVKVCIRSVILRESRRDAPPPSIPRRKAFLYSPPQGLNISDRKRLLSAGYPTLTELLSQSEVIPELSFSDCGPARGTLMRPSRRSRIRDIVGSRRTFPAHPRGTPQGGSYHAHR
jgi:hypothetical protein